MKQSTSVQDSRATTLVEYFETFLKSVVILFILSNVFIYIHKIKSKMKKNTAIFLIIVLFSSCFSNREELRQITIEPDVTIDQLDNNTYFQAIMGIFYQDGKLYLSENTRGQFFILNKNLSLYKTIGNKGRGPGEFLNTGHIIGTQDSIFIENGRGVSLFVNNKFIRKIPKTFHSTAMNQSIGSFNLKYAYINEHIYYYPLGAKSEILMHNIHTDENNIFTTSSIKNVYKKNRGHVVSDGEFIYVVLQNAPYIEKFSLNGELIHTYDYSNKLDMMDISLLNIDKQEKQSKSISTLVRDVSYHDGYLYLLIFLRDGLGNFFSNRVLMINTNNDSDMHLFCLDDGSYLSLEAYNNKLILFDIKNASLKEYNHLKLLQ